MSRGARRPRAALSLCAERSLRLALALLAAFVGIYGAPASAQLAAEAALQTDYRWRGHSMSDGQPVASLSLGYDDPSGLYAGAAAIGTVRHDDPQVLSLQANVGYARRLSRSVSVDAGFYHSQYYSGYGTDRHYHYNEAYLGLAIPNISARVSYSGDYLIAGTQTLYAELNGGLEPAPDWSLSAHLGALNYLKTAPFGLPQHRYDWSVGASRQLGKMAVHLEVSGRVEGETRLPLSDKAAVVGSITRAF